MSAAGAGTGMIMGAGIGVIFSPAMGPFGIVIGAGLGLIVGAAISGREPPADANVDDTRGPYARVPRCLR